MYTDPNSTCHFINAEYQKRILPNSSLIVLLFPEAFILHYHCPHNIHLDIAVAHSSLIVLAV